MRVGLSSCFDVIGMAWEYVDILYILQIGIYIISNRHPHHHQTQTRASLESPRPQEAKVRAGRTCGPAPFGPHGSSSGIVHDGTLHSSISSSSSRSSAEELPERPCSSSAAPSNCVFGTIETCRLRNPGTWLCLSFFSPGVLVVAGELLMFSGCCPEGLRRLLVSSSSDDSSF